MKHFSLRLAGIALALLLANVARADTRPVPTPDDVRAFVDGIVETELARNDVAGAVVVVVANGAPVLTKGYGLADVEKRVPVDARTLFRPGSISKLFTAIAVLQLVEQGKLELDADVNRMIDFALPPAFGKPVTLRQLLTHRAGFEERMRDLGSPRLPAAPLGEFLRSGIPRRSFEPERWPSYSNYGVALAGYIVERASGVPFDEYAAQHIFAPLGMERATFAQPLPAELAPSMSQGYRLASQPPGPFEVIADAPAGALSASGDAMARFLLAMIGGGELEGRRVLSAESFARMLEPQIVAAGNAQGLVIYEQHPYGVRLVGHGGDLAYFHSEIFFAPEHGFGVFVSQNSVGNGGPMLRSVLIPALAARYFTAPDRVTRSDTSDTRPEPACSVSGTYMTGRRSDHSLMRINGLGNQARVQAAADGTIELQGVRDLAGNPLRWRLVAPDRYRSLDGKYEVGFVCDASGRAARLLVPFPGVSLERARLVDTQAFSLALLVPSLAIALCCLLVPLVGPATRRALGAPVGPQVSRAARVLVPLTAGLWLAQLGIASAFFQRVMVEFWRMSRGQDGPLIAAVALAWLAAASSLATAVVVLSSLRDPGRSRVRRLASLLPVGAFLALTWFAWNWRMLSNPTQY